MSDIAIHTVLAEIFREIFEGMKPGAQGTWLVEKKEGIFEAMETVDNLQASTLLAGQSSTIGSHARHLNYYLSLFNAHLRKEEVPRDWEGSWKVTRFSEAEWKELAHQTRTEFESAYQWYEKGQFGEEVTLVYGVANIAHAAYHLGAIRALIPLVRG